MADLKSKYPPGWSTGREWNNKDKRWEYHSIHTPKSDTLPAICKVPPQQPGIIIFVHGVNSEGEWYEKAESGLVAGLNTRLNRTDLEARDWDRAKARVQKPLSANSPIIHFFWGYRAPDSEEHKWIVPLMDTERQSGWKQDYRPKPPLYWGGGPFQNGTNNLSLMWSETGFRRHVWAGPMRLDIQPMNPEMDRQLQDAPSRTYFVHAANRLAKLIDKIRSKYPADALTVVSHSQGTMVAMAAMFLVKTRVPDCLMLCNSPYAIEHKITDNLQQGNATATNAAREKTFANLVRKFQADKRPLTPALVNELCVGIDAEGKRWQPTAAGNNGVPERDNHGRVYVYFNPHDRVMGSTALQSIGWQGLPKKLLGQFGGTLYQRMLARDTECGGPPGEQPLQPADGKPFWNSMKQTNGIVHADVWATPESGKKVLINAEQVPQPVSAEELAAFDQTPDGEPWRKAEDFQFFADIYQREKYLRDGEDAGGQPYNRLETREEMLQRIGNYVPEPTDHSTLPSHVGFLSRVVAYDLPIGFCDSYDDHDFWKELQRDADWLRSDPYYATGKLEVPPMPAEIDRETFEDLRRLNDIQLGLQEVQGESKLAANRRQPLVDTV